MRETREFLEKLGLPGKEANHLPDSPVTFPDGAQYRVEIPSVEGPRALQALLEEADRHGLYIHRVSQGSGVMLLTDAEIEEMVRLCAGSKMELSLFVGPRASWDIGSQVSTLAGKGIAGKLRGTEQLVYAIEDAKRACALGVRGLLVADEGLLWVLDEMKKAGELPAALVLKVSVQMVAANPAALKVMERLGAGTYNIPTDLTLAQISSLRQAANLPLDIYVEAPDDFGGFVRYYEIPELVRVAAPLYVKFGLRNAPNIYPSGTHLEATAIALTRERVRRAALGLQMLQRYYPQAITSQTGAKGLAVPVTGTSNLTTG